MAREIFICQKCGRCCEGKGGIVLQPHDLARLAARLGQTEQETASQWAEISGGKLKLRVREGFCVFFRKGIGCAVHEAKPDVCRAWPFFRGNLEDAISYSMAAEYCPGINREAGFNAFLEEGLRYILANNLVAKGAENRPNALDTAHLFASSEGDS